VLSIGGSTTRVYLAVGATDMREGMDGLSGLVKSQLESDPTSGHLFVFCNAGRTRLKLIYFDGSGTWLCAKRLEEGTFSWPKEGDENGKMKLRPEALAMLTDGVELRGAKMRPWYERE